MLYDPKWKTKKAAERSLSQIYSAAADLIQERGHSIGELRDSEGRMCLWGAIITVVEGDPFKVSTKTRRMLEPLEKFTDGLSPVTWNNSPDRTKRQVVSLLRKAAKAEA